MNCFRESGVYLKRKCVKEIPEEASLKEIVCAMRRGCQFLLVKSKSTFKKRIVYVDVKNMMVKIQGERVSYCVPLCEVTDIRRGWNSDVFNKLKVEKEDRKRWLKRLLRYPNLNEDNSLSIVTDEQVLNLVAFNLSVCKAWVKGLQHLKVMCQTVNRKDEHDIWLTQQFEAADINQNGGLDFDECLTLLKNINLDMMEDHSRLLFNKANTKNTMLDDKQVLDKDEFRQMYYLLLSRPEIEELFEKYSIRGSAIMGPEQLQMFLVKEQKMKITIDTCAQRIEEFEPKENLDGQHKFFSIIGFTHFVTSKHFNIFEDKNCRAVADMKNPLHHYFIASSHNTYLIQDQIMGESSIEGYISAIQRGCRCVELDCHDGPYGEPVVYHGYTFTSKILFKDCIMAIEKYSFKYTQTPMILSLEDHCSVSQQKVLAQHLVEILGDKLCKDFLKDYKKKMPPPKACKGMIFVKHKKLKKGTSNDLDVSTESLQEQSMQGPINVAINILKYSPKMGPKAFEGPPDIVPIDAPLATPDSPLEVPPVTQTTSQLKLKTPAGVPVIMVKPVETPPLPDSDPPEDNPSEDGLDEPDQATLDSLTQPAQAAPWSKAGIAEELSDLVVYTESVKFTNLERIPRDCEQRFSWLCWRRRSNLGGVPDKFNSIISRNEHQSAKLMDTEGTKYLKLNRRCMTRIYPKGSRTDSSNYDPFPHLNYGCQIVSLNYQTRDRNMLLYDAFFARNNKAGYVLKPPYILDQMLYNPEKAPPNKFSKTLKIIIISGQQLPKTSNEKDIVDPYVSITVFGHKLDANKYKTQVMQNNGFNPMWYETITFTLVAPEMAVLLFQVKDESVRGKNELLGQAAVHFSCLGQGYRHIQLVSRIMAPLLLSSIFVHSIIT